jgi:dephospho-CoA kinase
LSVDEVKAIMAAQSTRAQRLAVADDVVSNDGGLDVLCKQVDALHQKYLQFLAEIPNASC